MQQKQPEEKLFLKHFPHSIKPEPFTPQILADKTSVPLFSNALTKVCFQSCTQQGCYQLFVLSSADSQPVLCLHVMSIFAKKFLLILNKKTFILSTLGYIFKPCPNYSISVCLQHVQTHRWFSSGIWWRHNCVYASDVLNRPTTRNLGTVPLLLTSCRLQIVLINSVVVKDEVKVNTKAFY